MALHFVLRASTGERIVTKSLVGMPIRGEFLWTIFHILLSFLSSLLCRVLDVRAFVFRYVYTMMLPTMWIIGGPVDSVV